jgi:hypothetical protein
MERREVDRKLDELVEKFKKIDFNGSFSDGCNRRRKVLRGLLNRNCYCGTNEFALYYLNEAKTCYVYGQFIACILMCQLVCSEMLKFYYRCAPGHIDVVNQYGFKKLIDRAHSDNFISKDIADKLHEMRKFRNLLEHTKDYAFNYDMILLGARINYESEDLATDYIKLSIALYGLLSWKA